MKLVNFLAFQLGWFCCVLGAAWGSPLLGALLGGALVLLHLALSKARWRREAAVLAAAGAFGITADSLQSAGGITQFAEPGFWVGYCPLWMAVLWLLFGTTLNSSLQWLQGRLLWAGLMGAVAGPLAYMGGQRLGAIELHSNLLWASVSVGLVYAIATPLLLYLARIWAAPKGTPA